MVLTRKPVAAAAALLTLNLLLAAEARAQTPAVKEEAKTTLDTVVVSGIRASREASLNQKRNADGIVEVITAEDIGKLPDKNVADAVQRIPGVNISSGAGGEGGFSENDRVSIRGTSASLTQTLINGHAVGTGDWYVLNQTDAMGRSVSYSLLPSEIVSRITVYKSAQADLVEGGVAGAVDIETRRPLSFKNAFTAELSAQALYSSLAAKTDPQVNALFNWKNAAGNAGVLVQLFSESRSERRDGQEVFGYGVIDPHSAAAQAHPELAGVLYPNQINNNLFTQKRIRRGGLFDIEIKPSAALTLDLNGFYSRMSAVNFDHSFMANPDEMLNIDHANAVPTQFKVVRNMLTEASFDPVAGHSPGTVDSIARPGAASKSWYLDFNGKLRVNDRLLLSAKLGTTRGLGSTPGDLGLESALPVGGLSYRTHGLQRPAGVSFTGFDSGDYRATEVLGAWWSVVKVVDREHYAQADAELGLDLGLLESVKFGVRMADHLRDLKQPVNGGCGWGGVPVCTELAPWDGARYPGNYGRAMGADGMPPMWLQSRQTIEDYIYRHGTPQFAKRWGEFTVKERSHAAYAMANLGGEQWRGNVGLRVVKTRQKVAYNLVPDRDGKPDEYTPVSDARSYTDALPSASLRFNLAPDLVSRLSAARTITRPDYSSMAGAITSIDALTNTGNSGNVELKPIRSNNYDATLEWYFAPKSLLSLGLFYMDIGSFVGYGTSIQMLPNPSHNGAIEPFSISMPTNVRAKNKGLELSLQQALGGGFGFSANYTHARGRDQDGQAMVGSSRHTYNLEGYFENERWNARLAYTHRSDYLVGLDRSYAQHAAGVGNLAASLNYKINEHLSLQIDGLNLNNPTLKYYGETKDQPRAFYSNGRQIFVGIRASL
ncbi:TonB-dependent receptor [Roseateles sp. DAIF2]|uniref:TonB-dependent receptor n=1 Tax=Roseateles sp. DAIF2 TaxID=2714952 RepID=UPI0018A296C8|nr:TonB-dependent receptor [Roseateles sp. DAIF2]QPF72610.1 TonB-dependent receptor [Roseateles sp. DAIF2]